MDRNRAIEVLERHNKWRRGDDELPQTDGPASMRRR